MTDSFGLTYPGASHPIQPLSGKAPVTKVLSGTSPEQVSLSRQGFRRLTVGGFKGNNTVNTGTVYLGYNSTFQNIAIASGATVTIEAGREGWPDSLDDLWLRGASGDGITGEYGTGPTIN